MNTQIKELETVKQLGKITSVRFGVGGYQDAMFGFGFDIDTTGGSIYDFKGSWKSRPENAMYSENEYFEKLGSALNEIHILMQKAKVNSFDELKGKPVEVTFEGQKWVSWRILEEVL